MGRGGALALIAATATVALAGADVAGAVTTARYDASTLVIESGDENNELVLETSNPERPDAIRIADLRADVDPGTTCVALSADIMECPLTGVSRIVLELNGGHDRTHLGAVTGGVPQLPTEIPIEVYGDRGPDWLDSAPAGSSLHGGPGRDQVSGNFGPDRLSGGPGRDTLSGDDGADDLGGGPGRDLLIGGADDDTLVGGGGRDQLDAVDRNRDVRLRCGAGEPDLIEVDRIDPRPTGCETVEIDARPDRQRDQ